MDLPSVLISILNWNNSAKTIDCIKSLGKEIKNSNTKVKICVIDNGSELTDYQMLQSEAEMKKIDLIRLDKNLGFTGGHNISISYAIDNGYKYLWLLNNDAMVDMGCLAKLVDAMENDERCGAVSPVIRPEENTGPIAAWGGLHEWGTRTTTWFESESESIEAHNLRSEEIFVAGTAIMLRTAALQQTGGLDDRLFAYYDDSDLGVRLAKAGWRSKVVFDASIIHGWRTLENLPLYFFYLMYRNEMIFWHTHSPKRYSRLIWIKLINQAIYDAIRLKRRNLKSQSDAALLGIEDFIFKKYGRPKLDRKPSLFLKIACKLSEHRNRVRLNEFVKKVQIY